IFALNDAGCSVTYNTTSPLSGSAATLCAAPTLVSSNTITTNSANITWTGSGSYIVEYGLVGFTPGTGATAGAGGTIATGNTSPVAITGLSAQTEYRVYVRQICAFGNYSANSTSHTIKTLCNPIATFPATEDFAAMTSSAAPACWKKATGGDLVTGPTTMGSSKWVTDGFLNNGTTGAAMVNLFNTPNSAWLISPEYQLPATPMRVVYNIGATQWASEAAPTLWEPDDYVELL